VTAQLRIGHTHGRERLLQRVCRAEPLPDRVNTFVDFLGRWFGRLIAFHFFEDQGSFDQSIERRRQWISRLGPRYQLEQDRGVHVRQ
jgi:hypothetical protein